MIFKMSKFQPKIIYCVKNQEDLKTNEKRQSIEAFRAAVISGQVSMGAWVAQSMKWPTLGFGSGCDLGS